MTVNAFRFPQIARTNILIVALLISSGVRADDWPQWRGPNRDGVYCETGIMESFPDDGLKISWRKPVGWGWSSPVVAEGRVFVTDSQLEQGKTAQERIHCLEATTGKPLWTYSYDVNYPEGVFAAGQEIGPTSTPIIEAGKLYALGGNGDVRCVDTANGEIIWQKELGKEYKIQELMCKSSPLLEGNLLIVFTGAKPGRCITALDKNSGNEVWHALNESVSNSSPIVITAGGQKQLILWTQESVTSLAPTTGTVYWRQQLQTNNDYVVSTPVFHENRLLIGGLMLDLDTRTPSASVLWPTSKAVSRRILSNTSTALFRSDYLFSVRSSGEFVCLEATTGKQVWETDKVTDLKGGACVHLTEHGDSVFLFTDKGELIRARLTSTGYEEISRTCLLEPTYLFSGRRVAWTAPAYANRNIFARNDKELICASLESK